MAKQSPVRRRKTTATPLDEERIRVRAYEISESDDSGTPEENWVRAEQELREAGDASV